MTLPQGYRMVQAATHKQPNLDYPYLSLPDIEEDDIDPVWEECIVEHLKQEYYEQAEKI